MSLSALIWNGLALVCWIWAVPFAGRALSLDRDRAALLVFALAPALIFQLFVHVGDPDQVLLSIPAWCLLGGYVVDMVAQRRDNTGVVATILVAVNMLLFLRPLPDVAGKSNARQVRGVDRMMNATFDRLREVTTRRPTCIVFVSNYVSWRHISYYFPDVPLYVLTGDPAAPRQAEPAAYLLEGRSGQQLPVDGNQIILPEGRDLLFLVPENHPAWRAAAAQLPINRSGAYPVVPAGSVERLSIGSYHFRVGGPGSGRIRQVVDGM